MQAVLSNVTSLSSSWVPGPPLGAATSSIAQACQVPYASQYPTVLCMQHNGAVLPEGFERIVSSYAPHTDSYGSTHVPGDRTFQLVSGAEFLIWDLDRAIDILGPRPAVEYLFEVEYIPHEGPAYDPDLNVLIFSPLLPPASVYLVDLNEDPPALSRKVFDPPLFGAGAVFYHGIFIFCGSATHDGDYVAGLYALNVTSGRSWPILNNYYGYNFGTCDDLAVASNGDIWFTDNWYAYSLPNLHKNNTIQLEAATYRFVPSTGLVQVVSDEFEQPNGIVFSPNGKTVYITDSGADTVSIKNPKVRYESYRKRTVYAADVLPSGTGMINRRAIFLSQDRVPDGIKVAANGYIVTATGSGVDVLDTFGVPILRVQTNFTVLNIVWAGKENTDLWMVGYQRVARAKWALEGPQVAR